MPFLRSGCGSQRDDAVFAGDFKQVIRPDIGGFSYSGRNSDLVFISHSDLRHDGVSCFSKSTTIGWISDW